MSDKASVSRGFVGTVPSVFQMCRNMHELWPFPEVYKHRLWLLLLGPIWVISCNVANRKKQQLPFIESLGWAVSQKANSKGKCRLLMDFKHSVCDSKDYLSSIFPSNQYQDVLFDHLFFFFFPADEPAACFISIRQQFCFHRSWPKSDCNFHATLTEEWTSFIRYFKY